MVHRDGTAGGGGTITVICVVSRAITDARLRGQHRAGDMTEQPFIVTGIREIAVTNSTGGPDDGAG